MLLLLLMLLLMLLPTTLLHSLIEAFRDCEVTFAGSKSPGWKDDVSFHPSTASSSSSSSRETTPPTTSKPEIEKGTPPSDGGGGVDGGEGEEGAPGSAQPAGDEGGAAVAKTSMPSAPQRTETETVTCRGKFWRNQNLDSGQYTLEVENGGGGAVLTLNWERWNAEVLVLKKEGRNLCFEGGGLGGGLVLALQLAGVYHVPAHRHSIAMPTQRFLKWGGGVVGS